MTNRNKIQLVIRAINYVNRLACGCCRAIRDAYTDIWKEGSVHFNHYEMVGLMDEFRLFVMSREDIKSTVKGAALERELSIDMYWWSILDGEKYRIEALQKFIEHLKTQGGADGQT